MVVPNKEKHHCAWPSTSVGHYELTAVLHLSFSIRLHFRFSPLFSLVFSPSLFIVVVTNVTPPPRLFTIQLNFNIILLILILLTAMHEILHLLQKSRRDHHTATTSRLSTAT